MKRRKHAVAVALTMMVLSSCPAWAEQYGIEGFVTKVIQYEAISALAIKHEASGQVTYHQIAGNETIVNRVMALAAAAQINGVEVHVLVDSDSQSITMFATVTEE